jgi:hypothetical protein
LHTSQFGRSGRSTHDKKQQRRRSLNDQFHGQCPFVFEGQKK